MNEEILSRELHRVADAAPVPTDLFPPDLLARRARSRRSRWIAVTATAAAMLLFSISPLGARALSAVGEVFMNLKVILVQGEPPGELARGPGTDISSIQAGETKVLELEEGRQIYTALTVEELLEKRPDFPLPTYLPPGPDAHVVQSETFRQDSEAPLFSGINMTWDSDYRQIDYSLYWRTEPLAAEDLQALLSRERIGVTVYATGRERLQQQEVTVNGMKATAVGVGYTWSLYWVHEYGGGSLSGNLPLETLIKVAESIPSLK